MEDSKLGKKKCRDGTAGRGIVMPKSREGQISCVVFTSSWIIHFPVRRWEIEVLAMFCFG
jgi:hypothetical protein